MLTRSMSGLRRFIIAVVALIALAGCSGIAALQSAADAGDSFGLVAVRVEATAQCERIANKIPHVRLRSGKPDLVDAARMRGDQLADYEENHIRREDAWANSAYRNRSSELFDVCIFDGDFETITPGPPGHDTSASRILVIVERGYPFLQAMTRQDKSIIPLSLSDAAKD